MNGVGEIEIATRDNLKRPIPWPGLVPELRGILPTGFFSLGEYQTGPVRVRIVATWARTPSPAAPPRRDHP